MNTTDDLGALLEQVRSLVRSARRAVSQGVNILHVYTNFQIGRLIVEHEQKGKKHADYGRRILPDLSNRLSAEFGRGFSRSNLEYMRKFFLEYHQDVKGISQTPSGNLAGDKTGKSEQPTDSFDPISDFPLRLSWSQYVVLMTITDKDERSFYEIEAIKNDWSLRELKRQFGSRLYERLALSRDKKRTKDLSLKGQIVERPEDVLKEPYVLEFLGIEERTAYSERELETAIIDKLEHFLLELGKGFLFEAR